ncbi:hypothetical protein CHS0354_034949 [Potamilus streckersoni]|uniref:Serine protease K12H4.7 n=2 Tax=Potamilus streckersoni TaxID=2493646 RepID=A0AAE0SDN9_9BIVA|nr:hypothetical protein CHS0354_034949 [Potamilus streckersoni]
MVAAPVRRFLSFLSIISITTLTQAWIPRHFRGRPKGGMLGAPRTKFRGNLPSEMWFDKQRLDHFNGADIRIWSQRYFVNDTFYKDGGPIFLMIGGEGTADPIWMVEGAWIDYARQHSAICFMVEHRYYGKSHPVKDLSLDNLKYLSSRQALADLAYFVQFIRQKFNLPTNKLISFGGSYSGSLSAWLRAKYPFLVDGAVATSAPIHAQLDFKEYLGVVVSSLATTGEKCSYEIYMATKTIYSYLQDKDDRMKLKEMFYLCDDIDANNQMDIANLFTNLAGNFEGVVQYNKDNRAFEGAIGTNITIDTVCGIMGDESIGTALQRYAAVNKLLLDTYFQKCMDFKYDKMISDLKKTNWNSSASEGGRQWTYQTCAEFGWFQSSDLVEQPFGISFPVNFSCSQCADIFEKEFTCSAIGANIDDSNRYYGDYGIKVTKVVFPNGSIDPWHAMGILHDLSEDAPAIYINGTAHCANMYPESPDDNEELKQSRITISNLIGKWLVS